MNKKVLILIAMIAVAMSTQAAPESVTVGTNSVILLPKRGNYNYPAWSTNTAYVVGQYIEYRSRNYLVTGAGTSTNTPPSHIGGSVVCDGVTFRYVMPGNRRTAIITTDCSTNVFLSFDGTTAELNKGVRLNPAGSSFVISESDMINDEIKAIAPATGQNVTVMDR